MNDGDDDASENLSTRSLARPQAFATLLLRGVVFNGVSIHGREEMKRSACLSVSHEYLDCLEKKIPPRTYRRACTQDRFIWQLYFPGQIHGRQRDAPLFRRPNVWM